jgi:hypothetical protein
VRNKTLESRIYRKVDVRFGGGSSEKDRASGTSPAAYPAGWLPFPSSARPVRSPSCSPPCWREPPPMRVERCCETCGRAFTARSWALARGWDRCCSRGCATRRRYNPSGASGAASSAPMAAGCGPARARPRASATSAWSRAADAADDEPPCLPGRTPTARSHRARSSDRAVVRRPAFARSTLACDVPRPARSTADRTIAWPACGRILVPSSGAASESPPP